MRYLGLDLGSKTLGLAISDKSAVLATSLEVLRYETYEELLEKLEKIIIEKEVEKIVLGNPLNMSGSISVRSEETFKFKEMLEKRFKLEVIMQDERLSTVEAEKLLINAGTRREKRKKIIDKLAATIILQTYLDRKDK
ncbi:MAG: Holliday junction resolvase RuvX [Bacilli bacterium]|nr:Holliday junction resolvase RuvX [Bacilli bacterium]